MGRFCGEGAKARKGREEFLRQAYSDGAHYIWARDVKRGEVGHKRVNLRLQVKEGIGGCKRGVNAMVLLDEMA